MSTKHLSQSQGVVMGRSPRNAVSGSMPAVPLWLVLAVISLAGLAAAPATPAYAEPPDEGFNPGADRIVRALAVQEDGKIVVGGEFTTLAGQLRSRIGRLNADGTLDAAFNPGANGDVLDLEVQAGGKIVVGGYFTTLGGQPRSNIGRLDADGTLDTSFNPGTDYSVKALAVQPNGRILVGGQFFTLGGQSRSRIGRLNADGTLDPTFNPGADGDVRALAVQGDTRIVVGGYFSKLGGQPRSYIGRLNPGGTVDMLFNPGATGLVSTLAVQTDGKIVVGGQFFTLGGQSRANIGRLNPAGPVDATFNPGASGSVSTLALQADGKIVVGGDFTTLGGQPRSKIGRLNAGVATALVVQVSGPQRFVPGDVEEYAVDYSNSTSQTVENAVLVVSLPAFADYLDNSGGGILWPQRNQLFWKLGNLAPGSYGLFSFRVRFFWGIPVGTKDTAVAQLSGTNLAPAGFNQQSYLSFAPTTVVAERQLTSDDVQAERQAYPELDQLYVQARQEGFAFGVGSTLTLSTGEPMTEIVLLRFEPNFAAMFLRRQGGRAQATLVDSSSYVVRTTRGAQSFNFQTDQWEVVAGGVTTGSLDREASATFSDCMTNCITELVPGFVIKNLFKSASVVSKGVDCYKAANTRDALDIAKCAQIIKKIPGVSEGIDLGRCNYDCQQNPDSHVCTADVYFCDSGDFPYGWFGIDVIRRARCITDPSTLRAGQYMATETYKVCAICEKCVESEGGAACITPSTSAGSLSGATARLAAVSSGTDSECSECVRAKDPNAKYGAEGNVLPGQPMTYTITFENEGAGDAFGVFVVDRLGEHLDTSTLTVYGGGEFSPASKTLVWSVGQLAPKGQPGSTGVVSFTARLKPDLASGTVVVNQAVVHFPSVPEETPTNAVVNVVQPLAAVPQTVETVAGQPVQFRLEGRSAGGASLTYAIVEQPLNGALSGTLPDLTYTPATNFTGLDYFRFTVSDAITTSRPDEVHVLVRPSANDATPPRVLRTGPENGGVVAQVVATPRFTDTLGPLYLPPIQIEFSEAISATTITTDTVRMTDGTGRALPIRVSYDGLVNQAMVLSREPLRQGTQYTVTVTAGAKDLMGNALAADYVWSFRTGGGIIYLPYLSKQTSG